MYSVVHVLTTLQNIFKDFPFILKVAAVVLVEENCLEQFD